MNVEFQKAGVRGVSILYSSGDGGVSGGQSQQCTNFIPTFPAGSPYVTAVGGTTGQNPETGVDFSSGGFTNYWSGSMAPYQQSAVKAYLTNYGASTLPPAAQWNATGRGVRAHTHTCTRVHSRALLLISASRTRAHPLSCLLCLFVRQFPDVSAQGTGFPVYVGGWPQPVDGTSCSAPTFSAIVSLLNDVRFAAGKSSLGFLNPLFYANPQVFNDITAGQYAHAACSQAQHTLLWTSRSVAHSCVCSAGVCSAVLPGNNPGCGTNGFTAVQGWDPVTGLGTPDFAKMATLVKSLP